LVGHVCLLVLLWRAEPLALALALGTLARELRSVNAIATVLLVF
jgi:hypothetical protein